MPMPMHCERVPNTVNRGSCLRYDEKCRVSLETFFESVVLELNHPMPAPKLGRILKDKLLTGKTVYGTLVQHTVTPAIVDFIPDDTLDFVIVTAEHNAQDLAEFLPLRYALATKGIACLVRTHSREPDDVSKVCDTFDGVVVPYVEDVEHAKRLGL